MNKKQFLFNREKKIPGKYSKQDPYWYAKDESMIKDIASLPFVEVSSLPISDKEFHPNPTLVAINFTPTIPGAEARINYATRAANAYYQSVAQGFSANFDFEAPDLLMLALAAASLQAYLFEGARAFGCLNYFAASNAGYPRAIIEGLGFDYDEFIAHKREFVANFNLRVDLINQIIAVPKDFFISDRWAYLSGGLFTEPGPTDYSTLFAYKHQHVLAYNGTSLSTGTSLDWLITPTSARKGATTSLFFTAIDSLIERLTGDDQRQMFAAIRRVYDSSQLRTLQTISDDMITEVHNNHVQSIQLHNSVFVDSVSGCNPFNSDITTACYQDENGAIRTDYGYTLGPCTSGSPQMEYFGLFWDYRLVSMVDLESSASNVLDITANILPAYSSENIAETAIFNKANMHKCYPRSEIVYLPRLYSMSSNAQVNETQMAQFISTLSGGAGTFTAIGRNQLLSSMAIHRMDYSPVTYIVDDYSSEKFGDYVLADPVDIISELDKYSIVSCDWLGKLNDKCAYTLLGLPYGSKSVSK